MTGSVSGDSGPRTPRLNFRFVHLHDRLQHLPMVRAVVPFAAGIAAAVRWNVPLAAALGGMALCGVLALRLRSQLYTALSLFLFGFAIALLHAPAHTVPCGVRTDFELVLNTASAARGGYHACEAQIRAWRDPESGGWHAASELVVVRADSGLRLRAGDRIVCSGSVRPFAERYPDYRRRMIRRGFAGTFRLTRERVFSVRQAPSRTLHARAVGRLCRLPLSAEARALCRAMAAGDRSELSPAVRTAYSRSGLAHLLAVSGLHVGIVFALVNALLRVVPVLWPRRGHLVRNGLAVALIWLYAAVADFSPSVVRAAVMFSMLQLALAAASVYAGLNALAAAAFLMLLFRPSWLGDLGFELSFLAVAAILAWGVPICRRLRTHRWWIDFPVATAVVSAVAAVATAPLVSHAFGTVSLCGLVFNPAAIVLAYVVVFAGVLWMAMPVGWLAPLFAAVLETAARWLDGLAVWASSLPWAAAEWRLTAAGAVGCYLFFLFATLAAACRSPKKSVSLPR